MKTYTVVLTEHEVAMIRATFNAREIRVNEWITEARVAGDEKQVNHWQAIIEEKRAIMKNINDQCDSQDRVPV